MNGYDKILINTFSVIVEEIIAELKKSENDYEELAGLFGFPAKFPKLSPQEIIEHATALGCGHDTVEYEI